MAIVWIFSFCSNRRAWHSSNSNYATKRKKKIYTKTTNTFGVDLLEHLSRHSGPLDDMVPHIVKVCAHYIEQNGPVFGIYRLSGMRLHIQTLRNHFETNPYSDKNIDSEAIGNDVHTVACVLKQYFRELPNPLITGTVIYDKLLNLFKSDIEATTNVTNNTMAPIHCQTNDATQATSNQSLPTITNQSSNDQQQLTTEKREKLDLLKQLLETHLPSAHYCTLRFLMRHLSCVADNAQETGMTTKNLAIVWAPNLLKPRELDLSGGLETLKTMASITEHMITLFAYDDLHDCVSNLNDGLSSSSSSADFHSADLIVHD